jgi:hypothetical protein
MIRRHFPLLMMAAVVFCLGAGAAAQAQGKIVGVGILIRVDEKDAVWITQVASGGPAQRAGIQEGDELLAVDGHGVADIPKAELPDRIRGAEGSEVTLTVRASGGRPRKLIMKRATITMPGAPVANASQSQESQGSMKFARWSVKDPGINNIEAASFLIPAGWKAEGGVQWFPNYSILASLMMRITDPQTGAAIEFLPLQNFTWLTQMVVPMPPGTNYLGNILCAPIRDVPQFIQMYYGPQQLRQLQGARLVASEDLPAVAAEISRMLGSVPAVKSARVRYEYQIGSQLWEETVYCTLIYTNWQLGTLWSVQSAYAFRAPKGQLDRLTPVMNATIGSFRLSLDWYAGYMYVQKLFNDRMNQSIQNAAAISETITRNSEEIRRMFSESYRQRSESQDRISQSFSEYIRGVDTYKNPFEDRQIQLPSGYQDAWVNARGEYILSSEAGFNPNAGATTEWRRMERRK